MVLRDVVATDGALTETGKAELAALARVAKAHPKFPILVVTHSAGGARAEERRQLETALAALQAGGAPTVEGTLAGSAQPLAPPKSTGAKARNDRIEVVFVSPAP